MQLKIQRSQRAGGVLGNQVVFALDVRADYTPEEQHNIRRYRLGGQVIYSSQAARRHMARADAHMDRTQSRDLKEQFGGLAHGAFSTALAKMSLNISIASLGRGHHIECKDLEELLEAEGTVREACKNVTQYLEVASTFDGSEMVIEYDRGVERIHFTQDAPPLLEYQASETGAAPSIGSTAIASAEPLPLALELGAVAKEAGENVEAFWTALCKLWLETEQKLLAFAASKGVTLELQPLRIGLAVLAVTIFVLLLLL